MSLKGVRAAVAVIFGLFSLLDYSFSASIPDHPVFEVIPLDPKGMQGQFQLVLATLEALDAKLNALQREIQEERAGRAAEHLEVVAHLEELHTAVDPRSAHLHYRNGNSSAGRKVLEMLIREPMATFFEEEDLGGEAVNYDSSNTTGQGGCQDVYGIKSMRISESCVRVFKESLCSDISRALYPKPDSGNFVNFLTTELPSVRSVGPCLKSEFQFSTVSVVGSRVAVTKNETNVRQVPDFVDFNGWDTFYSNSTSINSSTNPVRHYYMDHRRPKWIRAVIYKKHLKNNTESTAGMNMAIPPELGGPTNADYNTFSQTRKNFEEWKRITDEIVPDLQQSSNEWVAVYVTFVYDTPSEPNPYGFYYSINTYDKKFVNGFIEN